MIVSHLSVSFHACPNGKIRGANLGPILGRHDKGGPHVGPMNFATWVHLVDHRTVIKNMGSLDRDKCL